MSNTNRDYLVICDVKNSKITIKRPLTFYITDKNTSNIFIRLVTQITDEGGISQYVDIENASNYTTTIRIIKPNNEVVALTATEHEPGAIYQINLPDECKDIPGKYICELMITTNVSDVQEFNTSDSFTYEVKRSILSQVDNVIETEDTTTEKLLNEVYTVRDEFNTKLSTVETEFSSQIEDNINDIKIIKMASVNVISFGAKGDGVTDDTQSIQDAINYAYNNGIEEVYIPCGNYKISETLHLPFNLKLKGGGSRKTYIIISNNITDYALIYGDEYSYGDSKGEISCLCFKSDSDVCVSKGVYLNSGIKFYDFYCYKLKSCIHANDGNYIDNLKIINSTFAYCCGGEDFYVIDLRGNMDSLEIEGVHIVDAYTESSTGESVFSRNRGIIIKGSTGGYIKNCIINNCITLENVHGFSIENLHNEGSQHSDYKGNKSYIRIINSNVGIYNSYMHKRIDGENIIIVNNNDTDTHDAGNVSLNNVIIDFTQNVYNCIGDKTLTPEIIKTNFVTLKLNNCFVRQNFSNTWTTTNELRGVTIRDIADFNQHSSYLSYNCLISNDNNVLTDTPMVSQDDNITDSNMLSYSSSSENVPWHIDETDKTYYINCVVCFDYTRKLALMKNVTEQTITNVGKDKGILIRNNKSVYADGKGLEFVYYRGETSGVYNKVCRLPLSMSYYIFDTGTHAMGIKVSDRGAADIEGFNYVEKAKTINNGKNVEFYSSAPPTYGVFNKYDKCINTNINTGQTKEWVYNGSEWVSFGVY